MIGAIVGLIMIIIVIITFWPFVSAAIGSAFVWVFLIASSILWVPIMWIVLYPIDKQSEELESKMSLEQEGSPEYLALKKQYDETVEKHDKRVSIILHSIIIPLGIVAIYMVRFFVLSLF